jgi:hypothetical protein
MYNETARASNLTVNAQRSRGLRSLLYKIYFKICTEGLNNIRVCTRVLNLVSNWPRYY